MPCETAKAIRQQPDNARSGIAIMNPTPFVANNPPIIDKIIPQMKVPHAYGCAAGLSKSYPQFGQWYVPARLFGVWARCAASFAFCLAANSGFCFRYSS